MPRGGRRSGSAGKSYTNRTDLNTVRTLPATAATGQPYGEAGKQLAAQKIVPMGTTPVPAPAAPPAPMGPGPGELTALNAPSERPNEPLTHGLSIGAGAGPEIFPAAPDPVLKGLALLNSLGDKLSPEMKAVARALNISQNNGLGE